MGKQASITVGPTAAQGMFIAACREHGLPEPTPEALWHPTRKFRADYLWSLLVTDRPTILEIQGGIYHRGKKCPVCGQRRVGAHSSIGQMLKDIEKRQEMAIHRWTLVECLPEEVESGAVFAILRKVLLP